MTLIPERTAPKPPPENPEAEASLLGASLIDAHVYDEVVRGRIAAGDLSRDAHRLVLGAIERVAAQGGTIGFESVQAALAERAELEAVGGAQFLVGLMQFVPTVAHAETYARIVQRTALLRKLIGAANEIAKRALTREDAKAAVTEAQELLFAISETTLHRDIVRLEVALRRFTEQIESRGDERQLGIPTGFKTLDDKTGGLQPSDLIILAGRPGLGKTSFALCLVEHAAVARGKACAVFSMEMSELQVVQRLISMTAEIDGNRMRRGRLSQDEFVAISAASSRLMQAPIFVEESNRLTVTDILAKSRRLQVERGLDMVVVDYLQLIEGVDDDEENRVQEVSKISRSLKAIARELEVPVIALSQLNRQIETRGTEPMLSDLRECVTGDTCVVDAATRRSIEVRSLTAGTSVLAMSPRRRIAPFRVVDVWSTGVKPVFRLVSSVGAQIRATANHPFLTPAGWRRLIDLGPGELIATGSHLADSRGVQRASLEIGGRDRDASRRGAIAVAFADTRDAMLADATGDLRWEPIRSIDPAGEEEVFDLRVPGAANFLANGIVTHNSGALEQDADLVLFLWQKDKRDREENVVRLKLAKHRNGPTADIDLHFQSELTRFRDLGEARPDA